MQAPAPKKRAELRAFIAKFTESLGPQQTVIVGVPRNSRHARVMIEADYRMKKISKGIETVPGVTSTLDHLLAAMRSDFERTGRLPSDQGGSMARYWFELVPGHPTYAANDEGAQLTQCSIQVLTERQRATAQGALVDAGGQDGPSRAFARQLSAQFDEASTRVREFADLTNLYRLSAVLRLVQWHAALRQVGLDFGPVLSTYTYRAESPLPASLPAVANSREWNGRKGNLTVVLTPMVSGGVSMLMRPTIERAVAGSPEAAQLAARLTPWSQDVLRTRPLPHSLFWLVPGQ